MEDFIIENALNDPSVLKMVQEIGQIRKDSSSKTLKIDWNRPIRVFLMLEEVLKKKYKFERPADKSTLSKESILKTVEEYESMSSNLKSLFEIEGKSSSTKTESVTPPKKHTGYSPDVELEGIDFSKPFEAGIKIRMILKIKTQKIGRIQVQVKTGNKTSTISEKRIALRSVNLSTSFTPSINFIGKPHSLEINWKTENESKPIFFQIQTFPFEVVSTVSKENSSVKLISKETGQIMQGEKFAMKIFLMNKFRTKVSRKFISIVSCDNDQENTDPMLIKYSSNLLKDIVIQKTGRYKIQVPLYSQESNNRNMEYVTLGSIFQIYKLDVVDPKSSTFRVKDHSGCGIGKNSTVFVGQQISMTVTLRNIFKEIVRRNKVILYNSSTRSTQYLNLEEDLNNSDINNCILKTPPFSLSEEAMFTIQVNTKKDDHRRNYTQLTGIIQVKKDININKNLSMVIIKEANTHNEIGRSNNNMGDQPISFFTKEVFVSAYLRNRFGEQVKRKKMILYNTSTYYRQELLMYKDSNSKSFKIQGSGDFEIRFLNEMEETQESGNSFYRTNNNNNNNYVCLGKIRIKENRAISISKSTFGILDEESNNVLGGTGQKPGQVKIDVGQRIIIQVSFRCDENNPVTRENVQIVDKNRALSSPRFISLENWNKSTSFVIQEPGEYILQVLKRSRRSNNNYNNYSYSNSNYSNTQDEYLNLIEFSVEKDENVDFCEVTTECDSKLPGKQVYAREYFTLKSSFKNKYGTPIKRSILYVSSVFKDKQSDIETKKEEFTIPVKDGNSTRTKFQKPGIYTLYVDIPTNSNITSSSDFKFSKENKKKVCEIECLFFDIIDTKTSELRIEQETGFRKRKKSTYKISVKLRNRFLEPIYRNCVMIYHKDEKRVVSVFKITKDFICYISGLKLLEFGNLQLRVFTREHDILDLDKETKRIEELDKKRTENRKKKFLAKKRLVEEEEEEEIQKKKTIEMYYDFQIDEPPSPPESEKLSIELHGMGIDAAEKLSFFKRLKEKLRAENVHFIMKKHKGNLSNYQLKQRKEKPDVILFFHSQSNTRLVEEFDDHMKDLSDSTNTKSCLYVHLVAVDEILNNKTYLRERIHDNFPYFRSGILWNKSSKREKNDYAFPDKGSKRNYGREKEAEVIFEDQMKKLSKTVTKVWVYKSDSYF